MAFNVSNILSQPFWLATLGLYLAAWITATVSSAIYGAGSYIYWEVAYFFLLFLGVGYTVASDTLSSYRLVVLVYVSVGIVYATSAAATTVGLFASAATAASVGFMVMTALLFAWAFFIGLNNETFSPSKSVLPTTMQQATREASFKTPLQVRQEALQQQQEQPRVLEVKPSVETMSSEAPGAPSVSGGALEVVPDVLYAYKAQAMYAYTASVDDPNELSFGKGDVLEIVDNQGKWWQAKKADGSIGIVPSNYLKLLENKE
jgi:SHO1 osmosensor